MINDVEKFHKKFNLAYGGKPRALSEDLSSFRIDFLQEELEEYKRAATHAVDSLKNRHLTHDGEEKLVSSLDASLDALVDIIYIALGTAYLHGFEFEKAWKRVHLANMSKVRATSPKMSERSSLYDVIKPPGWQHPDHTSDLKDHAHKEVFKKSKV